MASTMTEKINKILLDRTAQPTKIEFPKQSISLPAVAPLVSQNSLVNKISEARQKQKTSATTGKWDTEASARKARKSADELYKLAEKSGFKKEADRILEAQKGEEINKIFSGGFISDTFDVLNALQYGVTGVLKGKGFMEGVKTRQSFSDKDALGDKGLPGVVAGIGLDILVDPLTYIAPLTILKKVPGLTKVAKAGKEAVFGKMAIKTIKEVGEAGAEITPRTFEIREGGTQAGRYLAEKFNWMFGQDPIYKNTWERSIKNIGTEVENLIQVARKVADLPEATAKKLLRQDDTGRFFRVKIDELKGLKPEEFSVISKAWQKIDDLGKEAVDIGLLSKEKYEENIGEYIKNAYIEYEQAKGKGIFGFMKLGVKGIKSRKSAEELAGGYLKNLDIDEVKKLYPNAITETGKISLKNLSQAEITEIAGKSLKGLGQIDNAAYLLFKGSFDLIKDIENTKLFNQTAKMFGSDVAQEGFKQLPITRRLYTTATGKKIEMFGEIKNLNQKLKPFLKELEHTFKGDNETLSLIKSLTNQLTDLSGLRSEEFYKFFQAGEKGVKTIAEKGFKTGIPDVEKLPKELFKFVNSIKKGEKYNKFELEALYNGGLLERNGFKSIKEFVDYAKAPAAKIPGKVVETTLEGDLNKLIKLQKEIEKLTPKLKDVKDINKRSINDSFRFLEDSISKIRAEREGLFEQIDKLKLGELSGKFVPENIFNHIQEITEPFKDTLGKKLIAGFKYNKVILNPATHARNVMSNTILNWWKLGLGPWRADIYAEAVKQAAKGGKWADEAKTVGYNLNTFASNELRSLLDSGEAKQFLKGLGGTGAKVKNKLADLYQGEENIAKMAAFIFERKRGLGIEEAWKLAESATFNYAQVTPFIRKLRTSLFGMPFITFSIKSAPIAVETALKHPARISVFGKIKNDIEKAADIKETERERASEPAYIRDNFYIKLPFKDKEGRSAYFDLTYILPFGDLASGGFFQRQIKRETGLKEGVPEAMLSNFPAIQLIKEITKNQDFYGDKIWQESDATDKQLKDLMRHLTKTYLPPLVSDQIPGGYMASGDRRIKGIKGAITTGGENQQRTLMQEMLRNVGAKIQPVNVDIQEYYQEQNRKKALENLLLEKGQLKEFKKTYIPKK